jgi:hypothetical protein
VGSLSSLFSPLPSALTLLRGRLSQSTAGPSPSPDPQLAACGGGDSRPSSDRRLAPLLSRPCAGTSPVAAPPLLSHLYAGGRASSSSTSLRRRPTGGVVRREDTCAPPPLVGPSLLVSLRPSSFPTGGPRRSFVGRARGRRGTNTTAHGSSSSPGRRLAARSQGLWGGDLRPSSGRLLSPGQ